MMLVESAMAMANRQMVSMVLVRRGDADNGAILVRLDLPDGRAIIERRIVNLDGEYEWAKISETPYSIEEADAYCEKEVTMDPDCWIVAIDSSMSDNPLRNL